MEQNKENNERYGIIYKIENTVNGKCYIGQTTNKKGFNGRYGFKGDGIEKVYNQHKHSKELGKCYNDDLLSEIETYGFDSFEIKEEYDIAYSKDELDELENKYIMELNCVDNGYNKEYGGHREKKSKETKRKISEFRKGKKHSEETRKKISENHADISGKNNPFAKKVICLNDGNIFDTMKECSKYYKKHANTIRRICKHIQKQTKDGLIFLYYNEYLQQQL